MMHKLPISLRNSALAALTAIAAISLPAAQAQARIVRLVIEQRSPANQGRSSGNAGAYEQITGHVFGEIDPKDPHNTIINDIELAPRNARGMVEYAATFSLLKPVDLTKASGVLIYSVPNRGSKNIVDQALFQSRGDIILFSGWQGDLSERPGVETVRVPVARNPDNSSITGPVIARFSGQQAGTPTLSLPGRYAAADGRAVLTRRAFEDGAIVPLAPGDWAFSDCRTVPFPGTPDPTRISARAGFQAEYLYELTYTAKDPLVLGVGHAAMRDAVSFFRRAEADDTGVANPLRGAVRHVIAQGVSQSGNVVKSFIHLGFNQDEAGKIVWDGANDHIAGRQVPLNFRFAIPGGAASLYEPGSEGVLWWGEYEDVARGRKTASLLDRSKASGTLPKVFETFGATEFWGLRMSPGLVGTKADRDIPLPPNVRRYYFPGTTHGGGRGGFNSDTRPGGNYLLPDNPNPQLETMRALMLALIDWVVKDTAPPPSKYPLFAEGQLVRPDHLAMGFPVIPGVPFPDNMLNRFLDYDLGPNFNYNDMSGRMSLQPPGIKQVIPSLVPKVDADGNEVGGIASALHQAPLGTYLGWNVLRGGFTPDRPGGFAGGFIPFARAKSQRDASGDPRPSLEERYHDHSGYVTAVKSATERLVRERFLLPDDAQTLLREAEASNVLR